MEPSSAVDALVHHLVLSGIATRGHAPTVAELAAAAGVPDARVEQSFVRLRDGHGLVLQSDSLEHSVVRIDSVSAVRIFSEAPHRTPIQAGATPMPAGAPA